MKTAVLVMVLVLAILAPRFLNNFPPGLKSAMVWAVALGLLFLSDSKRPASRGGKKGPARRKGLNICAECREPGAERGGMGKVLCRNGSCKNFDSRLLEKPFLRPASPAAYLAEHSGSFDPGPNTVIVLYRNFRGEDVEFQGDRTTVRSGKRRVSLRISPTGKKVSLAKKFVRNLSELESCAKTYPEECLLPVERQVLGYHRKHGTTSPRYEEVLRKHPGLK